MNEERFTAEVLGGHQGAAVEVPFDPAARWSIPARQLWRGRNGHHVHGTLNGIPFQSVIVPRSRKFFLLVDDDMQEAAGVTIGDTVELRLIHIEG